MLEEPPRFAQVEELEAPFAIGVTPDRRRAVIAPQGELDLATIDRLCAAVEELVDAGWRELVFDLRGLRFLDSVGLCYLIRQARRKDVRVQLVDGTEVVSKVFDTAGLRDELPFVAARPGWVGA